MSALPLAAIATGSTTEVVLFVVFAGIAMGAGIAMVMMRNIVHAALMLVANLLALAGLYLVLQTAFLSVVQVIVYAGAIMVLFLFVIMLLGIDRDDLLVEVSPLGRIGAVVAAVAVVGFLAWGMVGPYTSAASLCAPADEVTSTAAAQACTGLDDVLADADNGSVELVANDLFRRWTFPFEVSALLLVVATIGAMLLGRRHETAPDDDPAWVPSSQPPGPDQQAVGDPDHDMEAPIEPADGGDHEPVAVGADRAKVDEATARSSDGDDVTDGEDA